MQFVGDFEKESNRQRVYVVDGKKASVAPIPWSVIEYGAFRRRAETSASTSPAQSAEYVKRATLAERSLEDAAAKRALAALQNGTAQLLVQLCSLGGNCRTMQTAIDCMEHVVSQDQPVLTIARHTICSAAAQVFCYGTERWVETPIETMWHGRASGSERPVELRGRAEHDWSQTLPLLQKCAKPCAHAAITQAVEQARHDPDNPQMDVYLSTELVVESGLATQAFPHGSALWQALNTRTSLSRILKGRDHPLRAFCNTPGPALLATKE